MAIPDEEVRITRREPLLMDDIIQAFLAECWESVARVDADVVGLEKEPGNSDRIASILRTMRSVKGSCGFIGLRDLGAVAHAVESVLGQMHRGSLAASSSAISLVREAADEIKRLLQRIENGDQEHDGIDRNLIARLDTLSAPAKDRTAAAKSTPITMHSAPKSVPVKNSACNHNSGAYPTFTAFVNPAFVVSRTPAPLANSALETTLAHSLAPVVSTENIDGADNQQSISTAAVGRLNPVVAGMQDGAPTKLLLFDAAESCRMAVPVLFVTRLVEIPRDCIEISTNSLVARYGGGLLPLFSLEGIEPGVRSDPQLVIVFAECPNSFGLMVERVEDIAEERFTIRARSRRPGILGSAVIKGQLREILDVQLYIMRAESKPFGDAIVRRIAI